MEMSLGSVDTYVKDNYLYLKSGRLEIFTPQNYVDRNITLIKGTEVQFIGLANYRYYKNYNDEKWTEQGIIQIPSLVSSFPSDLEDNVQPHLYPKSFEDYNYTVLKFDPESIVLNTILIKDVEHVMTVLNLLISGGLDKNIPYNLLSSNLTNCMISNNINLKVQICTLDLIINKVYRDRNDKSKTFAESLKENPKLSMIEYTQIGAREICANDSVFSALTFEDKNSMIDASIVMTMDNKKQRESPLEKMMKY